MTPPMSEVIQSVYPSKVDNKKIKIMHHRHSVRDHICNVFIKNYFLTLQTKTRAFK